MSILQRMSRLLRANVNEMISKAEDPRLIIEQSLREMREAYQQARGEVAEAMAQASKLEREVKTNRRLVDEYQAKAAEALKAGNEDLAREALRRRRNHEDLAEGFEAQMNTHNASVDELRTQLRALEAKIDEMEARKELLAARQQTAHASQTMERMSGFGKAGGAMEAFEEMEQRVAAMEDKAGAMRTMREEGDFDTQLRNLGRDAAIDDDLARLKAELGGSDKA